MMDLYVDRIRRRQHGGRHSTNVLMCPALSWVDYPWGGLTTFVQGYGVRTFIPQSSSLEAFLKILISETHTLAFLKLELLPKGCPRVIYPESLRVSVRKDKLGKVKPPKDIIP